MTLESLLNADKGVTEGNTVRSHRWYRWKECSVFSPFKHPFLSTGVQVHGLAIGSRFLLHSFPMGGGSYSLRGHNPIWDCYFISLARADVSNRNWHTSAPKHTTDFPHDSVPVQTLLSYQDSGFLMTRLTYKVNSHILTVPAKCEKCLVQFPEWPNQEVTTLNLPLYIFIWEDFLLSFLSIGLYLFPLDPHLYQLSFPSWLSTSCLTLSWHLQAVTTNTG